MYTAFEIAMLREFDPQAVIPGIDTVSGTNQVPQTPVTQIVPFWYAPYSYNASNNTVYVMQNGAVLDNINFGSATVSIHANGVTIKNCTFSSTTGWYSLVQNTGFSGAFVENCTFTTNGVVSGVGGYISSRDQITITNNSFLDCPAEAIDMGAGVVSGNYISGGGYIVGAHPDGIWVTDTTGPVLIEDNFIDYSNNPGATVPTNDCIRVTTELGSVSNVTITGNYLIGGAAAIDAGNTGTNGTFSNISITNNYIGFNQYFAFYPGPQVGVTESGNVIFDFTNPLYSQNAWNSYLSNGIVTNSLVTASTAVTSISAAVAGTTTLYGDGLAGAYLFGGSKETIFVGGAGKQYLWGGSGVNIFSYLSPADSTVGASDYVSNFNVATDVIDLHSINAAPLSTTATSFNFIGGAAFSAAGGEVQVVQDAAHNQTLVEADLVGDSSADLVIRLSGLLNLTAANFALTAAQYNADIAAYTTVASFNSSQASLNQIVGGFSIVDTVANVQADISALQSDACSIDGITLTGGGLSVSTSTFLVDQTILSKIVGGFAVIDTGANIQANLAALEGDASQITSVSLSDSTTAAPTVLTLTAANAASDAAILAEITSPYVLDTTANGTTSVIGHGNGLTINVGAGDTVVTGGGTNEIFKLSANFGSMQITDFASNASSATHDSISLSTTDFGNWATLLSDGAASGANGANTTFTSADGASLTVVGMSLSSFQKASAALKSDFTFHA